MSLGIVELVTLLMGVSGFSVGTNSAAPTPQAALEYAMPDADLVAYADVGALVHGNYKVLTALPNQPQIKASPELAKAVKQMVAEIEGPRGLVKGMTGLDLATDVSDLTASFKFVPQKEDPEFVVAVHGKFTAATIEKVAKLANKQTVKIGGATMFDAGDGIAVGITKNNTIVAGSASLVKDRMADAWKAPALTAGTNLGNTSDVLAGKPVLALVIGLSPAARKFALDKNKGKNFVTDAIRRHKLWSFSVHRDGLAWTWIDSSKAGMDSMGQMSEGMVELMRAAQVAPRGFAKIVLGAIDSYKGTNKQVDAVIRRKGDIMKIVEAHTGDGQFKAQIDKDPRTLKLSVRLTGKTLSEVVPLGGLLPLAGMWLVVGKEASAPAPTSSIAAPPATPAPAPAKKQGNAPKRR